MGGTPIVSAIVVDRVGTSPPSDLALRILREYPLTQGEMNGLACVAASCAAARDADWFQRQFDRASLHEALADARADALSDAVAPKGAP